MNGFVAVTDFGWYQQLFHGPGPKDANFWRPSVVPFRLDVGTPFFFKLKAAYGSKVAGFGYFAGFTVLPDWLAWDTFGAANGVASLHELRARLSKIQHDARIEADQGGRIGCCLIAEARFFPQEAWVAPPRDWSRTTQTGARLDLGSGEGKRIMRECLERAAPPVLGFVVEDREPVARYGPPTLHTPRLGQSIFRIKVLDAYDRACAVTSEHSLPVLEAAHIMPYASGGAHVVTNGISLRSDLHRLFDRGYVAIDQDHRFLVGDRLKRDFENGRSYYGLRGQPLLLPKDPALHPSPEALRWHRERVFLG